MEAAASGSARCSSRKPAVSISHVQMAKDQQGCTSLGVVCLDLDVSWGLGRESHRARFLVREGGQEPSVHERTVCAVRRAGSLESQSGASQAESPGRRRSRRHIRRLGRGLDVLGKAGSGRGSLLLPPGGAGREGRSEEHTSELQSLELY
jgi:hypothetical protein